MSIVPSTRAVGGGTGALNSKSVGCITTDTLDTQGRSIHQRPSGANETQRERD